MSSGRVACGWVADSAHDKRAMTLSFSSTSELIPMRVCNVFASVCKQQAIQKFNIPDMQMVGKLKQL